MEEFPANSHRSRESRSNDPDGRPKVERVVTGKVIQRKQPLGRRIKALFVSGDGSSVAQYVVMDVLVPAAKDMVVDALTQGVERMFFGENVGPSRRRGYRQPPSGYNGYTSYNRYSSNSPTAAMRREDARPGSSRVRNRPHFQEIVLETRAEAEEVVDRMFDVAQRYDFVRVADLYDMLGVTGEYTDENWGWSDISKVGIRRVSDGYLLEVPNPEPFQ